MADLITSVLRRFWPEIDDLTERDRLRLGADAAISLVSLPLALLGLVWLAIGTDFATMQGEWLLFALVILLGYVLGRISFFQIIEVRKGEYGFNATSLSTVLSSAALLLLGLPVIWGFILLTIIFYAERWRFARTRVQRWNLIRNLWWNLWTLVVSLLIALQIYLALGGQIPLADLSLRSSIPAFAMVTFTIIFNSLALLLLLTVQSRLSASTGGKLDPQMIRQTLIFFGLSEIPGYFSIIAAGLYSLQGVGAFLFFMAGVVLVSALARRLSQAAMVSQQRSREVAQLEQLGRAIIAGPADASNLPQLLADYVPRMFIFRQAEIRLFPDKLLLRAPEDRPPLPELLWNWLENHQTYKVFEAGQPVPWADQPLPYRIIVAPIVSTEQSTLLGGICLLQDTNYALDLTVDIQPAMQALAAQIATTLHSAEAYHQALAHQHQAQELAMAGQIQSSLLPDSLPQVEGWELAASLVPALETSGDFYDAFPLPNGQLGLLVADVSDKGMGAALYMALSRTLLRTYAQEYHARPDFVLGVTNRRILADTQAGLFVSVFYAVLDPHTGRLAYCNAGHNPPMLLTRRSGTQIQHLRRTGMVLGVLEGSEWQQAAVSLAAGDMLAIYSDGITDAQNTNEEFFGEERLRSILADSLGRSAREVQQAVLSAVRAFVGDAPPFDDITLMILVRKGANGDDNRPEQTQRLPGDVPR